MIFSRGWATMFAVFSGALCAVGAGKGVGDWKPVVPGLDYQYVCDTNQPGRPWSIHLARLDRSHPELEVISTHAKNQVAALATVVSQVKDLPRRAGRPIAAINGDFFIIAKGLYQGDPLGLQILSGDLISAPAGASFWIEPGGKYHLGKVNSELSVTWPDGEKSRLGLNEERKTNSMVLFTPAFGPSTRTTNGIEFVLEKTNAGSWLPLRADQTYTACVRNIRTTNSPLSRRVAVISVGPAVAAKFSEVHAGMELQISTGTTPDVSSARDAVGGRPVLMKDGVIQPLPSDMGTNGLIRNPRTLIGWNERYFYFVVVDGRQKELSMGMTFAEMADFMQRLGCTDAINLDGGGSTTFWLNGKVMNSPSDKHERSVANALVIVKHDTSIFRFEGKH